MKKIVFLLLTVLMISQILSLGAAAASKQDVIDAARKAIPEDYSFLYLIQLENIFSQLEVTEEQCERIIEIINELGRSVEDSGHTLHLYAEKNRGQILEYFNEICDMIGLTYEYKPAVIQDHAGDVVCFVYGPDGKLLGEFDGDEDTLVKQTNIAPAGYAPSAILPLFAVCTAAAGLFVFIKNRRTLAA